MHDGWYHTGDTAWRDEEGNYWYVGRNDDVIKSSGYRIGPFEIESVMLEHDAVREVAVTGVPDPVRGFAVKATVVLADGWQGSDDAHRRAAEVGEAPDGPLQVPTHHRVRRRAAPHRQRQDPPGRHPRAGQDPPRLSEDPRGAHLMTAGRIC